MNYPYNNFAHTLYFPLQYFLVMDFMSSILLMFPRQGFLKKANYLSTYTTTSPLRRVSHLGLFPTFIPQKL